MFFYIIHSMSWGAGLTNGKRNARTAIIGFILYVILYFLIMHLYVTYNISSWIREIINCLLIFIFMLDIIVMCSIYYNTYGRSLLSECGKEDTKRWRFDETTGKYTLNDPKNDEKTRYLGQLAFPLVGILPVGVIHY